MKICTEKKIPKKTENWNAKREQTTYKPSIPLNAKKGGEGGGGLGERRTSALSNARVNAHMKTRNVNKHSNYGQIEWTDSINIYVFDVVVSLLQMLHVAKPDHNNNNNSKTPHFTSFHLKLMGYLCTAADVVVVVALFSEALTVITSSTISWRCLLDLTDDLMHLLGIRVTWRALTKYDWTPKTLLQQKRTRTHTQYVCSMACFSCRCMCVCVCVCATFIELQLSTWNLCARHTTKMLYASF